MYYSNHINRISKRELYLALDLATKGCYNRDYKELKRLVKEAGLFDDPDFPYDETSFGPAQVFKGSAARKLCKGLGIKRYE